MVFLFAINWYDLFTPTHTLEIILRGSVTYLSIFLLMRFGLKRESGSIGTADLLMVVMIADAAQNAMAGEYKSITDGLILVGTILAWDMLIDWANWRFPALRGWLEAPPLLLVRNGHVIRRNLRHEFVTEDELESKLRQQGVKDVSEVAEARMESDGEVSVIKK